jgi:hypothetical protein
LGGRIAGLTRGDGCLGGKRLRVDKACFQANQGGGCRSLIGAFGPAFERSLEEPGAGLKLVDARRALRRFCPVYLAAGNRPRNRPSFVWTELSAARLFEDRLPEVFRAASFGSLKRRGSASHAGCKQHGGQENPAERGL